MYTLPKKMSDFHGTVSLDPVKMLQQKQNQNFYQRPTHEKYNYLILTSDLEGLFNLNCTQLFPLSSGS